jgi:hypothetical protein
VLASVCKFKVLIWSVVEAVTITWSCGEMSSLNLLAAPYVLQCDIV